MEACNQPGNSGEKRQERSEERGKGREASIFRVAELVLVVVLAVTVVEGKVE
jgi:hypothetical protein